MAKWRIRDGYVMHAKDGEVIEAGEVIDDKKVAVAGHEHKLERMGKGNGKPSKPDDVEEPEDEGGDSEGPEAEVVKPDVGHTVVFEDDEGNEVEGTVLELKGRGRNRKAVVVDDDEEEWDVKLSELRVVDGEEEEDED